VKSSLRESPTTRVYEVKALFKARQGLFHLP